MNQVTHDARGLSSGTIAGLINDSSYTEIDKVQARFIEFCQENEGRFDTWVQAWKSFEQDVLFESVQYPTVKGEGAPQYTFFVSPEDQLSLKL